MRWTSKVVNLRVVVFYDGFNQSENNLSRVDNLMFTSYMNTLNYFIIPKLLKVVYYLNLLFCRRLQNNFWKKIYNYRTGLKKNIQLQNRTEKEYTITEPDWKRIYNYRTGLKKNIQLQNRTEKEYTITEPDWKKTWFSTHFRLSGVADRATT
jgi:hypothetical protein